MLRVCFASGKGPSRGADDRDKHYVVSASLSLDLVELIVVETEVMPELVHDGVADDA